MFFVRNNVTGPRCAIAVVAMALGGVLHADNDNAGPTLESLRAGYQERKAEIVQPVDALKAKYEVTLVRMQAEAKASNDVGSEGLIRAELEGFSKGAHVGAPAGELKREQESYRSALARLEKVEDKQLEELQKKYVAALESLMGSHTKARRFEQAIAVRGVLKSIKAAMEEREAERVAASRPLRDLIKLKPARTDGSEWFKMHYELNTPVTVAGTQYREKERIYAHAPSAITWEFEEPVTQFKSMIAVMLESQPSMGEVVFKVLAGGKILHQSEPVYNGSHMQVEIRFKPTKTLTLVTETAGVAHADHAFWIRPKVR